MLDDEIGFAEKSNCVRKTIRLRIVYFVLVCFILHILMNCSMALEYGIEGDEFHHADTWKKAVALLCIEFLINVCIYSDEYSPLKANFHSI